MSRRTERRPRGQALVEFAFVVPLFLLLMFAIIDFGRYVYYVQVINNAAREGARYAIVHGSKGIPATGPGSSDSGGDKVKSVVRNYAIGVIGSDADLVIDPQWPDGTNVRESTVRVAVTYGFRSLIPLVPIPTIEITGESTLVINN